MNIYLIALILIIIIYIIYKLIRHLLKQIKDNLKRKYGFIFASISAGLGFILFFIVPFFMNHEGENYAIFTVMVFGILLMLPGAFIAFFIGYFVGKHIEKKRQNKN